MADKTYRVVVIDEDGTVLDSFEQTYSDAERRTDQQMARKVIMDVADDIRFGIQ